MKAAIYNIETGKILRRVMAPPDHISIQCQEGEDFFLNCPADATDISNGEPVVIAPVPTLQELLSGVTSAVQLYLDATARTRNYDGILSLASYAVSEDPIFAAEGKAGAAWRDTCWRYCYQALAEVEAGTRIMPTPEEAIAELPVMVWPTI